MNNIVEFSLMQEVFRSLWQQSHDKIVSKSRSNCHARGVDSIVLVDAPEQRIRLFSTRLDHELWMNSDKPNGLQQMSVAFHPHHCDVTLICLTGSLYNWMVERSPSGQMELNKFDYKSQLNGKGEFKFTGKERLSHKIGLLLEEGFSCKMSAKDIHTIWVPKATESAWLVIEGKEDHSYESVCWSTNDLEKFCFDGMYIPMHHAQVLSVLTKHGLI